MSPRDSRTFPWAYLAKASRTTNGRSSRTRRQQRPSPPEKRCGSGPPNTSIDH
jgi:hypothetical protein